MCLTLTEEEIEFLEEHYRRLEAGEPIEMRLLEPCAIGSIEHAAQLIKIYLKQKEEESKQHGEA